MTFGTLYTWGYKSGRRDAMERILSADSRAVLLDIRFNPTGRPGTRRLDFQRRYGDRYRWLQALGNENYRGDTIHLHAPDEGVAFVSELLRDGRDVVLMCACAWVGECHRGTAAELVAAALPGVRVVHLDGDAA